MGQAYGGSLGGARFRGRPFARGMTARYPASGQSFAPTGGMFSAVPMGPSALQPTTAPQLSIAPPPALPTPGPQGPLLPQIPSFTPTPFVPPPPPAPTPNAGSARPQTGPGSASWQRLMEQSRRNARERAEASK